LAVSRVDVARVAVPFGALMHASRKGAVSRRAASVAGMSKPPAPPGPRVRPSIYDGDGLKMPHALARIRAAG
jgi:hypothetical protein